jgi:hypothetical protein
MYSKKIAFSLFTVPALGINSSIQTQIFIFVVFAQQGYEFQMRRKLEKENEAKRRYFNILLETILF